MDLSYEFMIFTKQPASLITFSLLFVIIPFFFFPVCLDQDDFRLLGYRNGKRN